MLKKFKSLLDSKTKKNFFILLFFLIFASFLEMVGIGLLPIIVTSIIDQNFIIEKISKYQNLNFLKNYLVANKENLLFIFGFAVITIFILKKLIIGVIAYFEGKLLLRLSFNNANRLYKYYLSRPYIFHLLTNNSIIARNIVVENQSIKLSISNYLYLFKEFFILLGIFLILIFADYRITIILTFIFSLIAVGYYMLIKNDLNFKSKQQQEIRGLQFKFVSEAFGSIKDILILLKEDYILKIFKEKNKIFENNHFFLHITSKLPRLILETVAIFVVIAITVLLTYSEKSVIDIISLLSLYTLVTIRLIPSYNLITSTLTRLKFISSSVDLISRELSEFEKDAKQDQLININDRIDFLNDIEVKNLSFKYPNTDIPSIKNLNEKIKINQSIGVAGPSGSGKSTFINLLTGLLKPDEGSIFVDKKNIEVNKKSWYEKIGYVSQDIFLIDDTIKKNIAFGQKDEEINKKNLMEAVKIAGLEDVISNMKNGLETNVGQRGVKISGGQKQRIGIARAIYTRPKLLILDEATNALDSKLETEVLNNISKLKNNMTLIIIAHRISTLRNCDKIFYFKDGNIISNYDIKKIIAENDIIQSR